MVDVALSLDVPTEDKDQERPVLKLHQESRLVAMEHQDSRLLVAMEHQESRLLVAMVLEPVVLAL